MSSSINRGNLAICVGGFIGFILFLATVAFVDRFHNNQTSVLVVKPAAVTVTNVMKKVPAQNQEVKSKIATMDVSLNPVSK